MVSGGGISACWDGGASARYIGSEESLGSIHSSMSGGKLFEEMGSQSSSLGSTNNRSSVSSSPAERR